MGLALCTGSAGRGYIVKSSSELIATHQARDIPCSQICIGLASFGRRLAPYLLPALVPNDCLMIAHREELIGFRWRVIPGSDLFRHRDTIAVV